MILPHVSSCEPDGDRPSKQSMPPDRTAPRLDRTASAWEPSWRVRLGRAALIVAAVGFVSVLVVVPVVAVFVQALAEGPGAYWRAISHRETLSACGMTLWTVACALPVCTVFGLAAGWAVGKFRFFGRQVLITLIDLPLSVSPVIAGLVFVLLFGRGGWFGPWLEHWGLRVIYATPGVILATIFVTFPYIARELIPLMEEQGLEQETAARSLGAGGWQIFRRITLPSIKWGLLYGLILAGTRAMGEFGAVSVVSGHIRGETNTLPLHVEILYNEYRFTDAFAVATLLTLPALAVLVLKAVVEAKARHCEDARVRRL